jgi:hypothetical protein
MSVRVRDKRKGTVPPVNPGRMEQVASTTMIDIRLRSHRLFIALDDATVLPDLILDLLSPRNGTDVLFGHDNAAKPGSR